MVQKVSLNSMSHDLVSEAIFLFLSQDVSVKFKDDS
jgi:hypothetical protein